MKPHTFCNYCGAAFGHDNWPRACAACGETTWRNPVPVAVLMTKSRGGLLIVQRGIEPGYGKLAMPGGFVDHGETWQQAASRELWEETGAVCAPDRIRLVDIHNSSNGNMLIFGVTTTEIDFPEDFTPNSETLAISIINAPIELAFPTQTQMCAWFFHNKANHWLV